MLCAQCSKLLADTNVPQFYPSMFVRITEVLDMFSNMVYGRLKMKAEDALTGTSHRRVKLKGTLPGASIWNTTTETVAFVVFSFYNANTNKYVQRNLPLLTFRAKPRKPAGIGSIKLHASPSCFPVSTLRLPCYRATAS